MISTPEIVLASSSRYRARALEVLGVPFDRVAPDVDETSMPGERPEELSLRLAAEKARAVVARRPSAIVIGSDQVGVCEERILGKPGSFDNAVAQLQLLSGRVATFYTSLVVLSPQAAPWESSSTTELKFRDISEAEARTYVELDDPIDCAGSFKSESLGIALFELIRADDPSALVGLPMISLVSALRGVGVNPLSRPD
jgi:septum formation protein